MDFRGILFDALGRGNIKGYEPEIAAGLLTLDKDELMIFKETAFFHQVMAAVWRNKHVMAHVLSLTQFSSFACFKILKHVELAPEECEKICDAVMGRHDVSDSMVLLRAITDDKNAILATSEEIWKTVFSIK